jgi:alkylhydroperoxidase family enzyme
VEDLTIDFSRSDQITEAERAMLHYAAKLTHALATLQQDDVECLRQHQFSDRAILEINQIAGYFAYVNRLASGLGVELEDFWNTTHT